MNRYANELRDFHMEKLMIVGDALEDIRNTDVMRRYYAGIGSRYTPAGICKKMTDIARVCEGRGYILRSGGAEGADSAFESGLVKGLKEIFYADQILNNSPLFELAAKHHPAWDRCSPYAKKLHARNCLQVLGKDLKTPVRAIICWTPNGEITGGTGQALRMAKVYDIPIFNLGKDLTKDQLNNGWKQFIEIMDRNEYSAR